MALKLIKYPNNKGISRKYREILGKYFKITKIKTNKMKIKPEYNKWAGISVRISTSLPFREPG